MRHIPPSLGFYGPSVTSISSLIAPALDEYVQLVAFEFEDKPYVFCTRDATRCQTSSAWSAYCKGIFKKWSGVACPPKMLVRPLHSLASLLHLRVVLSILSTTASFFCHLDPLYGSVARSAEASSARE